MSNLKENVWWIGLIADLATLIGAGVKLRLWELTSWTFPFFILAVSVLAFVALAVVRLHWWLEKRFATLAGRLTNFEHKAEGWYSDRIIENTKLDQRVRELERRQGSSET